MATTQRGTGSPGLGRQGLARQGAGLIRPDGTPLRADGPSGISGARVEARYLRDSASGVLRTRTARLGAHREDVRQSWSRVAALAMDLIQNSGRLKGAADQVLADTVGVGLTLAPDPDLQGLGYDAGETADWIRLVKRRWRGFWEDKRECDMRGRLSGPEMVDIALRWHLAFGEVTGVFDWFDLDRRARYGVTHGTKVRLYPPTRLVQETNLAAGLYQGVHHDDTGRPVAYRFRTSGPGARPRDFAAYDGDGRVQVLHVFEAQDSEDVRGISPMAAAVRKHLQAERLDDATLQMAILQTVFAVTLTSDAPSQDAFEALEAMRDSEQGRAYAEDYLAFLGAKMDRAAEDGISVGADPQVSHLAPGEALDLKTAGVPGRDFLPFSNALARDMARAIGITYGGLTMDHTKSTYSSVRMENASIWPVVMRRRARIAAPVCQAVYVNWLDEEVGEGRIPFKGGYGAFRAHRTRVSAANWQGPARPTADDHKSARAASERLRNGTSSIAHETGDLGVDPDALFEERLREHSRYVAAGMVSPYAVPGAQAAQGVESPRSGSDPEAEEMT